MLPDNLKLHAFPIDVWNEAVPLQNQADVHEGGGDSEKIDEYQFYVMRVGHSLVQIITWMEQLDHAVYYLSDFSYKKSAKEEGINRAKHLMYNVENYLIRLQSVYDRALQLTNNVFNLGVEDSNVGHSIVVSNLKVARTDISDMLKSLKKVVARKAQDRHAIVHRESYREDSLRKLELFYMYDEDTWSSKSGKFQFESLAHIRSQLMKSVVAEKKQEFCEINATIFEKMENLLTGLHTQYNKEKDRLHLYVYGKHA